MPLLTVLGADVVPCLRGFWSCSISYQGRDSPYTAYKKFGGNCFHSPNTKSELTFRPIMIHVASGLGDRTFLEASEAPDRNRFVGKHKDKMSETLDGFEYVKVFLLEHRLPLYSISGLNKNAHFRPLRTGCSCNSMFSDLMLGNISNVP
jgi:hypothetical protein